MDLYDTTLDENPNLGWLKLYYLNDLDPSLDRGGIRRGTVNEEGYYALIAWISCFGPRIFVTRVRLYARTLNAISVFTFFNRFIRKWVAPMRILMVPKGCSTVSRRTRMA